MSTTMVRAQADGAGIENMLARRAELKERAERVAQEIALIDDQLRQLQYGRHEYGDYEVQIQHNRRLDTARIEQRFPVAQYPHLYKASVNTAALKENLAPVELEQFYLESTPKVVVK